MRISGILIGLAIGATLIVTTSARADSAKQAFAKGDKLLAKADFEGSLAAYADAVRADRQNRDYQRQHAMVRQIIRLRKEVGAEQDTQRWSYMARALHSFYVNQRLYSAALDIDTKIHAKLASASSARMLGETMLAMNKDAEAAEMLAALAADKATASTEALRGMALAKLGKTGRAKQVADQIDLPANAGPRTLYNVARLNAAVGNDTKALDLLSRSFASMRPSGLAGFKAHATNCPEFAQLVGTAGFAKAMNVKSKVAESGCSSGRSCAGCPMRGDCSKDEGK